MPLIYALTFDGPIRYVGQTRGSLRVRLDGHRQNAREGKPAELRRPVVQWMREIGPGLVRGVVLERCEASELDERERYWIARLRAQGHDLLNVTDGGAGPRGWHHHPETIASLSKLARGRQYSPEVRAAWSVQRTGRPHTKRHQFADPAAQVDSGTLGAHNRWHVARGRVSDTCGLCAA